MPKAIQAKPDVALIDMGVGEPDEMASVVVEALQAAAQPENRGCADNGGDSFMQAARYMQTVFQVESTDWEKDVIHSIDLKVQLILLFCQSGDYALMTEPGYPVLARMQAIWEERFTICR